MSKIFHACGGKSIDDVEALVRERRELQVQVKIHQAERDGAVDDLRAYKDALTKSMVESAREKPKSLREKAKAKLKNFAALREKRTLKLI